MVRFSKFKIQKNKEIYEKFEEFLSELIWRETLFHLPLHPKLSKIVKTQVKEGPRLARASKNLFTICGRVMKKVH